MQHKIQEYHKEKLAYVYLRQSTMGQVRFNRESTERQYALKNRAENLGWRESQIKLLDNDLGMSGSKMEGREDFKILVADVSMGKVGAVFALEASRLSRSCTDWHRLLEICALTQTLIIDEDGCYNPGDFNDQLLLGLKGTMSQAELHFIRARLLGGKINKAKKGELCFPLPVGYCYDDQNKTVMDADEQVRESIFLIFKKFKEDGSACAVSKYFQKNNLQFPKRAYGGVWGGKLMWGKLTPGRVLGVLHNPSYAGAYVYGRARYEKSLSADGAIHIKSRKMAQNDWKIVIQDHHDGYITWNEYLENQKRLIENKQYGKDALANKGPVREGLTLLQGLMLCSYCGHKVGVRYQGVGGNQPYYVCLDKITHRLCFSARCEPVDQAITQRILSVIEPKQIQIAIAALEELENRATGMSKQWQLKLQRAEYESDLAQRRYEEVDPSNRLVAATLEKRWNESLVVLDELKNEYESHCANTHFTEISCKKDELLKLAQDFPKIWNAESTNVKDRKKIIRLLIKDIAIKRIQDLRNETAALHITWQGGATEELTVAMPVKSTEKWRSSPEIIEEVSKLVHSMSDQAIVKHLNEQNLQSNKGNKYTLKSIQWIRHKYNIPSYLQRKPGEFSVEELAEKLGVKQHVVRTWIEKGVVKSRRAYGYRYWITVTAIDEEKLRQRVQQQDLKRNPGEFSIEELAKKFDINEHVVRSWIKEGVIKSRKANGYRYWILLTPEEENVLRQKISSKN